MSNAFSALVGDTERIAGTAVDDGAHLAGDALSAAGLTSAARAAEALGDEAGYRLGADVTELQLGQTADPAQLVHGDPAAIRSSASRLRTFSAAFGQTADGLTGLDTEHWTGRAAAAFRDKFTPHPASWREASSATGNAGGALESYAGAVASAQQMARRAIGLYAAGQQATASAQAAYQGQVQAYDRAAQVYNARLGAGADPGSRPEAPAAFQDPGATLQAQAQQLLAQARSARDLAAAQGEATIKTAAGQAPAEPSFWSQVTADVSDSVQVAQLASLHFDGGVVTGAADIVKFARSEDPEDPWNLTHQPEYAAGLSGTVAGLAADVINPQALVKGVLGPGWGSDPAAALGHLVPSVALAVATGGGGAAADAGVAAESTAESAAESTALNAAGDGALGEGGDGAVSGLSEAAGDPALAARSPSDIPQAGDPVDVATGDVLVFAEDVSLSAGPGVLPLVIGRAYRSSRRAGRWFGPGWCSTFDQRLQVSPEQVIGAFADGRVLSWRCADGPDGPVAVNGPDGPVAVHGLPVAGPRWPLHRVGDGAFTVTDPQIGLVWRFERRPGHPWSPGGAGELPLVSVTDRAGHQVSFGYTPAGQPAWITHSAGHRIRVVLDRNRITGLMLAGVDADAEVRLVEYGYDPAGNLAAVTNSSGQPLRFRYDEEGRLASWEDRNGISYRYSYDEQGRCVAGAGPDGTMSGRFAYGDRVTWWTDATGAVTIYQLDDSSRIAAITDPLGNVTHFWHDEFGRTVTRADPLGRLTRYAYDERGNLTCVTRPDGRQARAAYDEANLPVRLEDPDGACWTQEYNARGNLMRQVAPDGAVTSFGYDERGHLASVTGPLGAVTQVDSDPAGRPTAVTGPDGGITRYTRDLFGRVAAITGPDGAVTELGWTVEGALASRVFADGTSERLGYDAEGNLTVHLSPAGEQTSYEYGPFDLVMAKVDSGGTRTEFRYDPELRLTAVDYAGLTWQYSYDAAGNLIAETDYNGATTQYAYDSAGQLTGRLNAVGQQVTCGYDELGNLTRRVADGVVTTFGYDAAGRLVLACNPDAELSFSRDPLGRVTAETCNDRTVWSSYDPAGRRRHRVTPGGSQQRWEYDQAGNPVLLEVDGQVLRFGYDAAGRETRRDLPGGLILNQDWDMAGQLTSQILMAVPGGDKAAMTARPWASAPDAAAQCVPDPGRRALARRAYTYRSDGYLTGVDDLLAGLRRFTLDGTRRVTAVNGPGWAERYDYDPAGNLSAARWSAPPPSAAATWLADDVQGARDRVGTLITKAGTVRYQYDQQGRVLERQRAGISRPSASWSYQWDADDRLTAVTTPDGSTWRYKYDPLGRRVSKQRLDPSGVFAEETSFTWDGAVLAEEATQQSTHQRRVTWVYRPGTFTPIIQSERVSASEDPQQVIDQRFYAIITDQLGTPAELVSATGAVAGHQQHTLWGGTLWHPGGASTPLRLPGQYYDPETGLHYNHQRYYDPVTGGYLTPDPLGLAPAPNPHAYVPNPHLHADPLGLMACGPEGTAAGQAGASGRVALDTNVLIGGLDNGELGAVGKALAGRAPVVSPTAANEYLVKGNPDALGEFLRVRGGKIGMAGTTDGAAGLRAQAAELGRNLGRNDALIAHSAMQEGIPLITRDQQLLGFLRAIHYPGELF